MSLNLKSLIYLLFMLAVAVVIALIAVALRPVQAHLADRPQLDSWAMDLHADNGVPCCDGADATPLIDADWKVDGGGHYTAHIDNEWVEVPDGAVVTGPNKYGQTLIWYIHSPGYEIYVRCFLPGAGT